MSCVPGAKSAVYDCLVLPVLQVNRYGHLLPVYDYDSMDHSGSSNVTYRRHRRRHGLMTSLESRDRLRDVIESVATHGELPHCRVLLDCLVLLATDDRLPLFL